MINTYIKILVVLMIGFLPFAKAHGITINAYDYAVGKDLSNSYAGTTLSFVTHEAGSPSLSESNLKVVIPNLGCSDGYWECVNSDHALGSSDSLFSYGLIDFSPIPYLADSAGAFGAIKLQSSTPFEDISVFARGSTPDPVVIWSLIDDGNSIELWNILSITVDSASSDLGAYFSINQIFHTDNPVTTVFIGGSSSAMAIEKIMISVPEPSSFSVIFSVVVVWLLIVLNRKCDLVSRWRGGI